MSRWKWVERLALSVLHRLEYERAHNLAVWWLKFGYPLVVGLSKRGAMLFRLLGLPERKISRRTFPSLESEVFGLSFATPLGMAAGDDKKAEIFPSLLQLGFSSVEVGTFTPHPQEGNPKPRLFRLDDEESIINRMGLNNCGFDQAEENLRSKQKQQGVVGVSIGAGTDTSDKIADYVEGVMRFSGLADYLVLNLSCPNIIGGRDLQKRKALERLFQRIDKGRKDKTPLLLKIAPDLSSEQEEVISRFALDGAVDGLVISNTRPDKRKVGQEMEQGGLSGRLLFEDSTQQLKRMYKLTEGCVPLVGVGGIFTAKDAYDKILAGASLVQLYTALIYKGSSVIDCIHEGLVELLERDGYESISDAVGQGVSHAVEQEHDAFQQTRRAVA